MQFHFSDRINQSSLKKLHPGIQDEQDKAILNKKILIIL
jgi:hypothetical protein